jgi:hypothetical protein
VSGVDYVGYLFEVDVIVGLHECDSFYTNCEDVDQALAQISGEHNFLVDLDVAMAGGFRRAPG